MKIRNGFVSNSSSSSFVVLTSIENHERAMEKLSEYERAVVDKIMYVRKDQLFGKTVMVGGYMDAHGYSSLDDIEVDVEDDKDIGKFEAFDYYVGILEENKNEVFTHGEDM